MVVLIACIGYIVGILYGLYIKKSIALFFLVIFCIYLIVNKVLAHEATYRRIKRYAKIFVRYNLIVFVVFAIISNTIVNIKNDKFNYIYKLNSKEIIIKGFITNPPEEKNYTFSTELKVDSINGVKQQNTNLIVYIKKLNYTELKYGDYIEFTGVYEMPETSRNYGGFSYREYLKSKNIYGIVNVNSKIDIRKDKKYNKLLIYINNLKEKITYKIQDNLAKREAGLLIGIILGDKQYIGEDIINNFKLSNLSHMLAVSGAHTTCFILGISFILKGTSKRITNIIIIIFLVFFMALVGFTPSVVRASIMGIILVCSKLFYRKPNIAISISFSLLLILMCNPFSINDIGLQLSFCGTLGIILFNRKLQRILKINKKKSFIKTKILNLVSVSISAQILIMPIMILNFNTISFIFLLSNVLATPIFTIIVILGFVSIVISFVFNPISKFIFYILSIFIKVLISICDVISVIPFCNILVTTPSMFRILLYYIFVLMINYIYILKNKNTQTLRNLDKRILKSIKKINFKKVLIIILIIVFVLSFLKIINIFPKNLKIHFIDVGQGDSTLIITPSNKTVLVDGGGSRNENEYSVGEKILIPYLLDRKISKLDYILISHFDSDHVRSEF